MAERSDHSDRDKRDRIERLRKRLADVPCKSSGELALRGILQGILDLLADEL
jgi:hypothetical protein